MGDRGFRGWFRRLFASIGVAEADRLMPVGEGFDRWMMGGPENGHASGAQGCE